MDKRAPAKSQQFENRVFLGLLSAGSLSVATYFCLNLVPTFAYQSYVAVFSAFFVLLLSSLIIKRLLVHPIDAYTLDIEQLIEALPLLAKKKYEDARSMCVLPPDDERFFNAHNLRTTLFDLTSVLEELDSKVSQRNKAVFKAHQALKEERDFITQLVDSAQ
ncbi:MAG TPA: GGDEF domain-containing protein, partial [Methylophaga aminisulfidivorans]|nr:GGDEF domain-containing protein [Methylophaga aminisulfidivorans]